MAESYYLMAAIFLPLLLSPVAYILGRKKGIQLVTWFSFGVLAISTCFLIAPITSINKDNPIHEESFSWSQFGNFGLRLDGLSIPFAVIIYILCTVLALYSKPYMLHKIQEDADSQFGGGHNDNHGKGAPGSGSGSEYGPSSSPSSTSSPSSGTNIESTSQMTMLVQKETYVRTQTGLYFALYLTFSMGMLGTVLATNLIEFYVFFELMLVPAFFMVAFYGYGARRRIALMFFFWTHVGAVAAANAGHFVTARMQVARPGDDDAVRRFHQRLAIVLERESHHRATHDQTTGVGDIAAAILDQARDGCAQARFEIGRLVHTAARDGDDTADQRLSVAHPACNGGRRADVLTQHTDVDG